MAGQKMRLNVVAFLGEEQVGKFLVCVDEGAFVQDLAAKIRNALSRSSVVGELQRLVNTQQAHLPEEESVGDVLRDGEEVVALLREPPPPPPPAEPEALEAFLGLSEPPESKEEPAGQETLEPIVGPAMAFEEDMQKEKDDPLLPDPFPGDWEVSDLTPKLREYVATRFQDVHGAVVEPGTTFITVTMRSRELENAISSHYSIARIDVIEFERLCAKKVQEMRARMGFFVRCQEALESLLERGASSADLVPNMVPYTYRADQEFDDLLREADCSNFGYVDGNRPMIIVDTSGAVGEVLPLVRAALKRLIYSFLVTKSRFNFMKFSSSGRPVAFDGEMVSPSAPRLREAEEFLDALRHVRSAGPAGGGPDLLEALRLALAAPDVDSVYLVTSGLSRRLDAERFISDVRAGNARALPIHVIGIECDRRAELDMRRLADDNRGSFRQKRFDGPLAFNPSEPRRPPMSQSADQQMTIQGQADILQILLEEETMQCDMWLEEQKCANQLLLVTATQQPVVEQDTRSSARSLRPQRPASLKEQMGATETLARTAPAAALASPRSRQGPRRGATQPGQRGRASSQPQATGTAASVGVRRPSVANPWDRPYLNSGVVRVSQLKQAADAAARGHAIPAPSGHGGVATPGRPRGGRTSTATLA